LGGRGRAFGEGGKGGRGEREKGKGERGKAKGERGKAKGVYCGFFIALHIETLHAETLHTEMVGEMIDNENDESLSSHY
jgi:hypothetical protein